VSFLLPESLVMRWSSHMMISPVLSSTSNIFHSYIYLGVIYIYIIYIKLKSNTD
jgi:hypothetical protein